MNRTKRLLISMLTLLCCCTGAWALDQDGEGYYLIGSVQDWKDFATLVQTTPTANARMTADVDLGDDQTMIGTSTPYQGTFDGKGHTLTINYTVSSPFRNISNATIKNIHVAGTIDSSTSQSAPIGICRGSCTVENLWSSLTVTAWASGWQEAAGIVGLVDNGNLTMNDCLFSGSITTSSEYNGCFVGYIHQYGSATIKNCLSIGTFNYSNVGSDFRGTHINCYVKQFPVTYPVGVTKATDETLADGSIAYKLQADREDLVWGQLIGSDTKPVQTNDEGYRVYRSINGGYTNDPTQAFDGIQQDAADGYYLIGSIGDWWEFADIVETTPTANAKMTEDIDLGDNQKVVGYSSYFKGIFDGQGHTITVNLNTTKNTYGLFCRINGATIKNLRVAGTINTSTYSYIGGIVGLSYQTNTITNCRSSVTLNASLPGQGHHGGLVGYHNGTLNISECIFDGVFEGKNTSGWGGLVGYKYAGAVNINNCLFNPAGLNCSDGYSATFSGNGGTVTNSFYTQTLTGYQSITQGTQATAEELAEGSIAFKLQNYREDLVWGQLIGTDLAPVLTDDESYRVYRRSKDGGYTNDPTEYEDVLPHDVDGYYLISSAADCIAFANAINDGMIAPTSNAKLTTNIDLAGDANNQWTPIGTETNIYNGTFDGQGFTIKNLYYKQIVPNVGLFGVANSSAYIKNVRVEGFIDNSIDGNGDGSAVSSAFTGGIIGRSYGATVLNCSFSGNIISHDKVGGIVGYGSATIVNCYNEGTVTFTNVMNGPYYGSNSQYYYGSHGGGILGYGGTYNPSKLNNCYDVGRITNNGHNMTINIGAISGYSGEAYYDFNNCYSLYSCVYDKIERPYNNGGYGYAGTVMSADEMKAEAFVTTLNTNVASLRADYPDICEWTLNSNGYPVHANRKIMYKVPSSGIGTFSNAYNFTVPEGLTAHYCKTYDTEESTISVVSINGAVPANTGVVLKGTPGETYTLTGTNSEAAAITDNALVAVVEATHVNQIDGDYTNFMMSGGKFIKIEASDDPEVKMPANRAYLHILTSELPNQSRSITLCWDNETTGIQAIRDSRTAVEGYYNLTGQRVDRPTKGLYIVNGKKIVIK
jgi:hypothetical protein